MKHLQQPRLERVGSVLWDLALHQIGHLGPRSLPGHELVEEVHQL